MSSMRADEGEEEEESKEQKRRAPGESRSHQAARVATSVVHGVSRFRSAINVQRSTRQRDCKRRRVVEGGVTMVSGPVAQATSASFASLRGVYSKGP